MRDTILYFLSIGLFVVAGLLMIAARVEGQPGGFSNPMVITSFVCYLAAGACALVVSLPSWRIDSRRFRGRREW